MLAFTDYPGPDDAALPCLIAHGLFGSARNWAAIAKRLSEGRRVVAVDMRNHGESPATATHTYPDQATDLAEVIDHLGGRADVIGHSMGGKAAMTLALADPDRVNRLVIGDIAPAPYTHSQLPFLQAMRAVDLSGVTRRSEAAAQLDAQGVAPALQAFFTQSLDVAGKRWRYNLDTLEADMPKIMGFPADPGPPFPGPVLFLAGADSDYIQPEHRAEIRRLFPAARIAKLRGAGHWLHADKPREFTDAVAAFLG